MANTSNTPVCTNVRFIPNTAIYCMIQGHVFSYRARTKKIWVQIGEQWALATERQLMEHPAVQQLLEELYNTKQLNYKTGFTGDHMS